jgi:Chaperone for flagella basal body P-ring formation
MSYRHCSGIGRNLIWLSMLSMDALLSAQAACYNTPAAALNSMKPASSLSPMADGGGYRMTSIESDPISGQRWATISSCDHPERPAFSLLIEGSNSAAHSLLRESQIVIDSVQLTPVVHVGDTVRLWRQEAVLRIELAAVAEQNGSLGKLIRVRLLRRSTDDQSTQIEFAGIVRGRFDVEMQP